MYSLLIYNNVLIVILLNYILVNRTRARVRTHTHTHTHTHINTIQIGI